MRTLTHPDPHLRLGLVPVDYLDPFAARSAHGTAADAETATPAFLADRPFHQ